MYVHMHVYVFCGQSGWLQYDTLGRIPPITARSLDLSAAEEAATEVDDGAGIKGIGRQNITRFLLHLKTCDCPGRLAEYNAAQRRKHELTPADRFENGERPEYVDRKWIYQDAATEIEVRIPARVFRGHCHSRPESRRACGGHVASSAYACAALQVRLCPPATIRICE